jgi:hypothetical protein
MLRSALVKGRDGLVLFPVVLGKNQETKRGELARPATHQARTPDCDFAKLHTSKASIFFACTVGMRRRVRTTSVVRVVLHRLLLLQAYFFGGITIGERKKGRKRAAPHAEACTMVRGQLGMSLVDAPDLVKTPR